MVLLELLGFVEEKEILLIIFNGNTKKTKVVGEKSLRRFESCPPRIWACNSFDGGSKVINSHGMICTLRNHPYKFKRQEDRKILTSQSCL